MSIAGRKWLCARVALWVACAAIGVSLALSGCGQKSETPSGGHGGEAKYKLAVIPKGTAHPFWRAVHAGAAKAAQEFDVDIIWKGTESESARKEQIELVQDFISKRVDAIVVAPLDKNALVRPVESAVRNKIPVVVIDSGLESNAQSSFVATDNEKGGRMGADRLAEIMNGQGRAFLLRYSPGSASTHNREEGFLKQMREEHPGIELVSTDQFAGTSKGSAFKKSQDMLIKYPDIEGIFCPNESSTFGMLRALQKSGKASQVKFVGFDATESLVDGLRKGHIQGLVAQDPFTMGYTGVKTAVEVVEGKQVPGRIRTKTVVVTPQNVDDPDIQEIISPPVDKWLD